MLDGFEWDPEKARTNAARHKVRFEEAVRIFEGPRLERLDMRFDYGEPRHVSLGAVDGRCLVVVHTPRGGRIRLISARKANRHEQRAYYEAIEGRQ